MWPSLEGEERRGACPADGWEQRLSTAGKRKTEREEGEKGDERPLKTFGQKREEGELTMPKREKHRRQRITPLHILRAVPGEVRLTKKIRKFFFLETPL